MSAVMDELKKSMSDSVPEIIDISNNTSSMASDIMSILNGDALVA